jgi:hypothetical protein
MRNFSSLGGAAVATPLIALIVCAYSVGCDRTDQVSTPAAHATTAVPPQPATQAVGVQRITRPTNEGAVPAHVPPASRPTAGRVTEWYLGKGVTIALSKDIDVRVADNMVLVVPPADEWLSMVLMPVSAGEKPGVGRFGLLAGLNDSFDDATGPVNETRTPEGVVLRSRLEDPKYPGRYVMKGVLVGSTASDPTLQFWCRTADEPRSASFIRQIAATRHLGKLLTPDFPCRTDGAPVRMMGGIHGSGMTNWRMGAGIILALPDATPVEIVGGAMVLPLRKSTLPGLCAVVLIASESSQKPDLGNYPLALPLQNLFDQAASADKEAEAGPFVVHMKQLENDNVAMHAVMPVGGAGGPKLWFWGRGDLEATMRVVGMVGRSASVLTTASPIQGPAGAPVDSRLTGKPLAPNCTVGEFLAANDADQQLLYRRLKVEWYQHHSRVEPGLKAAQLHVAERDVPGLGNNLQRMVADRPQVVTSTFRDFFFLIQRQAEGW